MDKQKFLLPAAILLLAGGTMLLANARAEGNQMHQTTLQQTTTEPAPIRPAESPAPAIVGTTVDESTFAEPEITKKSESDAQTENPWSSSVLPGESRNLASLSQREVLTDGFYAEPLSEELIDFMKGSSIPVNEIGEPDTPGVNLSDLRYLHIMYINFQGDAACGELICNKSIANDLLEIFEALYDNAYPLERVELIEAYGGDDNASMAANNTSCFNYRVVENTTSLSNHAYGVAIDINPFYNPYIAYTTGEKRITPEGSEKYENRSLDFPHKIDAANDLCYQLFIEHGFAWGGAWKSSKDYQHFQKPLK